MSFVTFNGFNFNFNMLPHTDFMLYRPVENTLDDGTDDVQAFDNGQRLSEPLVSSNTVNITYNNTTGGNQRIETNGWWSHVANVPKGAKLVCDDGRTFYTQSKGRSDVVPGSFYYVVKEVDNDG